MAKMLQQLTPRNQVESISWAGRTMQTPTQLRWRRQQHLSFITHFEDCVTHFLECVCMCAEVDDCIMPSAKRQTEGGQ